jgi:hypothetical protein
MDELVPAASRQKKEKQGSKPVEERVVMQVSSEKVGETAEFVTHEKATETDPVPASSNALSDLPFMERLKTTGLPFTP